MQVTCRTGCSWTCLWRPAASLRNRFCIAALPCLSWNACPGENRSPPQILDAWKGPTHRISDIPVTKPLQHVHCSIGPWVTGPAASPALQHSRAAAVPVKPVTKHKSRHGKLSAKVAEPEYWRCRRRRSAGEQRSRQFTMKHRRGHSGPWVRYLFLESSGNTPLVVTVRCF